MSLAFISHSDVGVHDNGWNHPEHVGRIRAITRAMRYHPELFMSLDHVEGRHATEEELSLGHDPAYIARVRELAAQGGGRLDADTVVSAGSWDAARAAAGCVLEATERALDGRNLRSFVAVRPPGHHALRAQGMGFCLFGSVAIAALHALTRGAQRVLIVDWDVHHGNGTQALVEHVDAATEGWTPDLVLVSSGFDSMARDPLGGFTLELEDVTALTRGLVERAERWCGGRLVSALEGGYDPDRVGAGVMAHMQALV